MPVERYSPEGDNFCKRVELSNHQNSKVIELDVGSLELTFYEVIDDFLVLVLKGYLYLVHKDLTVIAPRVYALGFDSVVTDRERHFLVAWYDIEYIVIGRTGGIYLEFLKEKYISHAVIDENGPRVFGSYVPGNSDLTIYP